MLERKVRLLIAVQGQVIYSQRRLHPLRTTQTIANPITLEILFENPPRNAKCNCAREIAL